MKKLYHTISPELITPSTAVSAAQQLKAAKRALTKTELLLYESLREWLETKQRRGEQPYVCPSRKWIASTLVPCSIRTVSRAFKKFAAVGLLEIRQRWRRGPTGRRLRRQMTNLIALPFWRPPPERDKNGTGIISSIKSYLKKEPKQKNQRHRTPQQQTLQEYLAMMMRKYPSKEENDPPSTP